MLDYTKILKKLQPRDDGEDVLRLRVGTVDAINSDGTADITASSGVVIPDVPVLSGAGLAVADVVQILSLRGSLFVIGATAASTSDATPVVVTTTTATVGTVASGFSVNDVRAATALGGKHVDLDLYIQRSGADITATSGNITDTLMFTLNSAYYPSHTKSAVWSDGTASGEAIISTAGAVTLRTASSNIVTGRNVRLASAYLKT